MALWELLPLKVRRQKKLDGYKVLYPSMSGKNESAAGMDEETNLEYKLYVWTMPEKGCGPLCVFKKYKDAKKFRDDMHTAFIMKCKFIPDEESDSLWTTNDVTPMNVVLEMCPGTKLAKAIMPTKEM